MDRSRPGRTTRTRKARTVPRPRPAPVAAPTTPPAASFTATDAKKGFGRVLEIVLRGGRVLITRHDQPKAVVLSMDEFNALTQATERTLQTLSGHFDALLADMQTPKARAGLRAAFEATPREIGRAAAAAARRRA